jgi:hypothetical protein
MVRRVNSRRGEVDRSPSVMTSNTGTGRRGHSGGDPRGEPRGAEVDRSPSVMQSSGGLRERFVTPKYIFLEIIELLTFQNLKSKFSRIF